MEQLTMNSREVAQASDKLHKHVLEAIRNMEPAWEIVTGTKFRLSDYTDPTGRKLPQYILSKSECLYVATKFNDEARAKLILRWEELERKNSLDFTNPETVLKLAQNWADERRKRTEAEQLASHRGQMLLSAESTIKQQAPKVEYYEKVLNSEGLISVTEIAADLGLSALRLNKWLFEQGLQFKVNGSWVPAAKIKDKDFMRSRTYTFTDHTGVLKSNLLYYWTERGRRYVMELYRKLNINK